MEFMLIIAFSLIMLFSIVNLLYSEYNERKEDLDASQTRQVLQNIAVAAQRAYYDGYPSRTTLELFFPKGIKAIKSDSTIMGNLVKSEITFTVVQGELENDIVVAFPFNTSTDLSTEEGKRNILIKVEQQSDNIYVNITQST